MIRLARGTPAVTQRTIDPTLPAARFAGPGTRRPSTRAALACRGCDTPVASREDAYCPRCRVEIEALSDPERRIGVGQLLLEALRGLRWWPR